MNIFLHTVVGMHVHTNRVRHTPWCLRHETTTLHRLTSCLNRACCRRQTICLQKHHWSTVGSPGYQRDWVRLALQCDGTLRDMVRVGPRDVHPGERKMREERSITTVCGYKVEFKRACVVGHNEATEKEQEIDSSRSIDTHDQTRTSRLTKPKTPDVLSSVRDTPLTRMRVMLQSVAVIMIEYSFVVASSTSVRGFTIFKGLLLLTCVRVPKPV
jgi:hypothetical protein